MYLLFDIGASHMRLALSNGKKIIKYHEVDTPHKFTEAMELFAQTLVALKPTSKIKLVVGGVAGPLNKERTKLTGSNLPDWVNKPLKAAIEKIANTKVVLTNDAQLAALGEAHFGAGKGAKIVAYLTFSSGHGGARIVDGKIDQNIFGFEPGHQLIGPKPLTDRIQPLVSGYGAHAKYHKMPKDINDPKFWSQIEQWMSVAVNNTSVFWSPNVIVLGGGVSHDKHVSIARVAANVKKNLGAATPKIVHSKLLSLNGIHGALAYLQQLIKK